MRTGGSRMGTWNESNLKPNWDQQASLVILLEVLGDPWVVPLEGPWRENPWRFLGGFLEGSLEGPWRAPWRVLGGSLEGPWGLLGGSLEGSLGDQTGTQGWTGTGPAPGAQKVPKVYKCRHKQAQGQTTRQRAAADFGTPWGTL